MKQQTSYIARQPDNDGIIRYSAADNRIWKTLISRQMACIKDTACEEFLSGLTLLNLPQDHIPQLSEIDDVLYAATGWRTAAVPALIGFDRFFELLSQRRFPVATFIRSEEDLDYIKEPDIFHEIFGHCAMLANQHFADFTAHYGKLGVSATPQERVYLARLYWFTVEFGLVRHQDSFRVIGGGILSSPGETRYAFSHEAEITPLEPLQVLRTPYRIDIMQPEYFLLNDLAHMTALTKLDLMALVHQAMELGLLPAKFPQAV